MKDKHPVLLRMQAAIQVLKGNDVYWKDGKLLLRQRTAKGHFQGVELNNPVRDTLEVLRDKLKKVADE